jgi:competence protein ComEC
MATSFGLRETLIVSLCCAYILGLLAWVLPWGTPLLAAVGLVAAVLRSPQALGRSRQWGLPIPSAWWRSPPSWVWIAAAMVSLLAAFYLQLAQPYAAFNDVSRLVPSTQASISAEVTGLVQSRPTLTRRGTAQIWLTAQRATVSQHSNEAVSGNVFVTLPRKAAETIHFGQTVTIQGILYKPQRVTRPHGFDFAAYLAREGAFAGLKVTQIRVEQAGSSWGGWAIRARIVRSLQHGTGTRTGALLGALVLGKDAADVPYDLKDAFIQSGLAHALAASGFQVSLILAVVLGLGRSLSTSGQVLLGAAALLLYGLLSGAEASIVRAILMGCASLLALWLGRKIRPVPTLLIIATLMLMAKPLWIWDLGFQLSVLATLGLIVTARPLAVALDRLPPTLATMISVPLAATLWTLPLQLYTFGVLPLYGLLANVVTALLLSVLTIGGFISSLAALVWPLLGSGLAWFLFWPTQLLMLIVQGVSQLPGNALALGSISLIQLLALYGCIIAVWLVPQCQKQWRLFTAIGLLLIVIPIWQTQTQRFVVTVFDQTRIPMMVIQHPQGTVVINSGDRLNASQSLVPFLQQEGINRIDWAIDTDTTPTAQSGWIALLKKLPIQVLSRTIPQSTDVVQSKLQPQQQLEVNLQEHLTLGPIQMVLWRAQPTTLELQIGPQRWLLVDGSTETDFTAWLTTVRLPPVQVLWWRGQPISPKLIAQLHPETLIFSGKRMHEGAIASSFAAVTPQASAPLEQVVPNVFWTQRDGTIQWTSQQRFTGTINPGENNLSPLG